MRRRGLSSRIRLRPNGSGGREARRFGLLTLKCGIALSIMDWNTGAHAVL